MIHHGFKKGKRVLVILKSGEKIDKLLENGYSTISLGYIGLYECVVALIGLAGTVIYLKKHN